ncbi:stage II sporulation protein M, partial [Bacillus mycoides]
LKPIISRYILTLAVSVVFLAAAGAIEAYLSPSMMKSVVSFLGK